ncbi:uncharacterized protein LOC125679015 isoform X2 [Ostrea edulis]|nr:uncharacterized protein LOC125679015 isoform X2 [Ostrea edulis]
MAIAPLDRQALRLLYEEQKEDSFVHPEPVYPDAALPTYEEAVALGFKGFNEAEDAGPTHAGEGNTAAPQETVFLGKNKRKLKRKKSHKKDGEELRINTKPEPTEDVEMSSLQILVKSSDHKMTEDKSGETSIGPAGEEDSPIRSRKKKKKKSLMRKTSEADMQKISQTVENQGDIIIDISEGQGSPERSQRKKEREVVRVDSLPVTSEDQLLTSGEGHLLTNGEGRLLTNGKTHLLMQMPKEMEEKAEGTVKKSKKKRRETSPREMEGADELAGQEESLWQKAKKKSKKRKKKIREKEVIEAMTGKEIPDPEVPPPQLPTAAFIEEEIPSTRETKETRALPPLLTKRMSSLNKIHTKDSQLEDRIPDQLREDTTLMGKSIPPIASVMDKGQRDKAEEDPGLEEKKELLLKRRSSQSTLEQLRSLEEGRPHTEDSEERKENIKCTNPCCAAVCGFFKRLWRFITKNRDLTPRQKICIIAVVISSIAAIVFLGLFPSSFVYLDYHEYALKYDKVTGVVDRSTVYEFGCYILGPSTAFLTFPRSAHIITKSHGVFTADKMSIDIVYHVQYFLRKSEIGTLHSEFDTGYDSVIRSIIESKIKNSATSISVNSFRLNRANLEKYFHNALKERLEGNCCPSCCPGSCTNITACSYCLGPASCDQGYHVTIKYFQLTKVKIPKEVSEQFLKSVLLEEYANTEQLKQNKAVEDKITQRQTSQLHNEAYEITEAGNAEAQKIQVIAEAEREANLTTAYVTALSSMYTTLNVVQEDHKLSIMMMRVLEEAAVKGKLYRSYGYDNETIYNRPLSLSAG